MARTWKSKPVNEKSKMIGNITIIKNSLVYMIEKIPKRVCRENEEITSRNLVGPLDERCCIFCFVVVLSHKKILHTMPSRSTDDIFGQGTWDTFRFPPLLSIFIILIALLLGWAAITCVADSRWFYRRQVIQSSKKSKSVSN